MKIPIPHHAATSIIGATTLDFVKHSKIDISNSEFLINCFYNGGQLLTIKQAIRIYKRLDYLHTTNTNEVKKNKAIMLNGGTGFYSFLQRTIFSQYK